MKWNRFIMLCVTMFAYGVFSSKAQIVYADYSDPDVCEGADGDYWMTASSFQCAPGLPILHSTDLVHWSLEGYGIMRLEPKDHYATPQHGNGVWAPSIRRHNDTYYIYWGDPDYGIFMVKTKNPRGKWDDPVLVVPGEGLIDSCPLWDDDGRVWLVNGWANSRCGFNSVLTVRELSADGTRAIGEPRMVYDGLTEGNHTIEGPKFYKRDGYYYILAPAGSVATGWQLALRSKNVYGPYESKIVFNDEGIHQGGMVASPAGSKSEASFICFQERAAYGRILHLLDVKWEKCWPMMSRSVNNKQSDNKVLMAKGVYGNGYTWHTNPQEWYGFDTPTGAHRVYGCEVEQSGAISLWNVCNLWLKKIDGESYSDTLRFDITAKADGQESGFVIMGRDYCSIGVEYRDGAFVLKQSVCKDADKGRKEESKTLARVASHDYAVGTRTHHRCTVWVKMTIRRQPTKESPYNAVCSFAYSSDGKRFTPVADEFTPREGKWIGAKYGAYSITRTVGNRGWCDVQ